MNSWRRMLVELNNETVVDVIDPYSPRLLMQVFQDAGYVQTNVTYPRDGEVAVYTFKHANQNVVRITLES